MSPQNLIHDKIPFLKYTASFGLGIIVGSKFEFNFVLALDLLIISLVLLLVLNIVRRFQIRVVIKLNTFLLLAVILISGVAYSSHFFQNQFQGNLPEKAQFSGYILEKSPSKNNRFKYVVKLTLVKDSSSIIGTNEKILLYNADSITNAELQPGQQIVFRGYMNSINSSNNPGEFDYQEYMKLEGIRYQTYIKSGLLLLPEEHRTLKTEALRLRSRMLNQYLKAGISGDEFAVLAALTLGNKDYLSSDLKSSFAASGAMHVLAVSGLHVGIIFLILKLLLKPLNKVEKLTLFKVIIIILLLWTYAFITGLSPSVLRSCTMFSLIVIGENLKRKTNIYNTLAFSAFVLMLFDPAIIYKVGFQLSYAAVISIVFFQPKIAALLKFENKIAKWSWELFAVSLAAQIGTFPLSIYYFHQFPSYFWLSNFVAIPAATLLLYLAFFFFITLPIPYFASISALLIKWIVIAFNQSIIFIEKLPGAVVNQIWIDNITVNMLILLILTIAWTLASKSNRGVVSTLMVLLAFLSYSTLKRMQIFQQSAIVFYNTYSDPLISIIDGKHHYYYSTSDSLSDRSTTLLANCANFYNTNAPINISGMTKMVDDIVLHNNIIFYRDCIICIQKYKSDFPLFEKKILWFPKNSQIILKKSSNLIAMTLKKGKIINITNNKEELSFNNQNSSPLIINLSQNKMNTTLTDQHF